MLDRGSSTTSDPLFCQIGEHSSNHRLRPRVIARRLGIPMSNCADDGALRDIRAFFGRSRVGADARRRRRRATWSAACARGDRRARGADRARALHGDRRAPHEHRRGHERHRRHRGGRRRRHRRRDRRGPHGHQPDGGRAAVRRQPPVRAVVRPAGHRQDAVPQAHRAHAVVGPQHDDLGHPRARRRRGREQGLPDHQRAGGLPPAPPGAVGVEPLLGGRAHRLRVEPLPRLPAAADGGTAVAAAGLGGVRGLPGRHGRAPG